MNVTTLAQRRHDNARLKKNRSKHVTAQSSRGDDIGIGRKLHTNKACSCWMCGNPRRYFKDGLTIQEKSFLEVTKKTSDF